MNETQQLELENQKLRQVLSDLIDSCVEHYDGYSYPKLGEAIQLACERFEEIR